MNGFHPREPSGIAWTRKCQALLLDRSTWENIERIVRSRARCAVGRKNRKAFPVSACREFSGDPIILGGTWHGRSDGRW